MDNAAAVAGLGAPALNRLLAALEAGGAAGTAELLEALPLGVAVLDASDDRFTVLYANARLFELTDSSPERMLGRPLGEALEPPEEMIQAVNQARRRGGPARVRFDAPDGRRWDFEATRVGDSERRRRLIATWHEVREDALHTSPLLTGEAGRNRSQFLNMAAHELRTPLSVIAGYVSMLADGTLGQGPAAWQAPLAVLVQKTSELAHLIDDILLAGRLESGKARTSGRTMDLSDALRDAVERARARAEMVAASVDVQAPAGPVLVHGDVDHVARILDNLVNNAFNYSRSRPRVRIALETDRGWALLRVQDSGRGIAPEHRELIFHQFYRVEDPADGFPPGTGLGLYISRALAERCGGSLELEWSEPEQGSRFLLRLPLAQP